MRSVAMLIVAWALLCSLWLAVVPNVYSQEVTLVLSDEDYHDQCVAPQFSPAEPCGLHIRPVSAPLDCSQPQFSPRHPFCTIERRRLDFELYNCDGFSPTPVGCLDGEI